MLVVQVFRSDFYAVPVKVLPVLIVLSLFGGSTV